MAKVTMPQLGESVAEGTIGKWLKQPGDHVDKYEPLLEVITDKVNAEVPSPFEGVLKRDPGRGRRDRPQRRRDRDHRDRRRGRRAGRAPAPARRPRRRRPSRRRARRAARPAPTSDRPRRPAAPDARRRDPRSGRARGGSVRACRGPGGGAARAGRDARRDRRPRRPHDPGRAPPAARARPESPSQIDGTGGGGRITRDDVLAVVESIRTGGAGPARLRRLIAAAPVGDPGRTPRRRSAPGRRAPIAFPDGADEVLLPMTQMRKGIAAQMTRALAVPHAYVHMEVDVTGLVRARETAKREYQAREGISLSYVPFVIKATVEALKQLPDVQRPLDRRTASSPSGASTWASRSPSTTGCSSRSSATSTSSRSAASTAPSPTSPPGPGPASCASTTSAAARSRSTTPAGSART